MSGPSTVDRRAGDGADARFDAFISYNRGVDGPVAAALQQALHRFDKPWNRLRALRVFRDDASLGADPRLWGAIERALDASRYLILLASPAAAGSAGGAREVRYWLENRSQDDLLIGLTAGELHWVPGEGIDAATTTALPAALLDRFSTEPRYVDLRWARDVADLSLRDPRFQDAVAELASPLRGKPKDVLIGDDVRQHRRTVRVRNGAVVALATLLVASVVAAVRALQAGREAVRERDVALSRLHAIRAAQLRTADTVLSRYLSVAAHLASPTLEARSSVLSTASLPPVTRLVDHDGPTLAVATGADGHRLVTAGVDGRVRVWSCADPRSPRLLGDIPVVPTLLASVAVTADGTLLAAGTDSGAVVVTDIGDPATPRPPARLDHSAGGHVTAVGFGPRERVLASGGRDGTVRLWDLRDPGAPRPVGEPAPAHEDGVRALAFSPDGALLATGGSDRTVRLWRVTDSGLVPAAGAGHHDGSVAGVAFSPDGRLLVTGGLDRTVRLWHVDCDGGGGGGGLAAAGEPLRGHDIAVYGVAFGPSGTVVASAGNDNAVRVWDLRTSQVRDVLPHPQNVQAVRFLGVDDELATVGDDGALRLWHLPGSRLVEGAAPLGSVVTLAGDRLATGGRDGTVGLWDLTDPDRPAPAGTLSTEPGAAVQRMTTGADGTLLAVPFDDGRFELWRTDPAREPVRLATVPAAHAGGTFTAALRPDGRLLATGGPDTRVRLWDVTDPGAPAPLGDPLPARPGAVFAVALGPDGDTLAAGGGEGATWLYDVSRPQSPVQLGDPLGGHGGPVYGVAFSPSAPLLATAGVDGLVRLWDVTDRRAPRIRGGPAALENDGGAALWVAFDRAGHLAVANADGSTCIWDVGPADPVLRARLVGHEQAVMSVIFLADGDRVVTASADRTGVVWRLDADAAAGAALTDVGDPLTDRERRRYLTDAPP